ncbi:MAG TPA: hypothetical protein VE934_12140 [Polaromonas sp.]|uniref:hypothetical protein n=1 Tax=Polaromonas sp. TaxID=1869339 RepID=UPI002D5A5FED|nr:hypothetical protein [Polaromonas sp.]HYW57706.1 hypothetical protein [Polaromonas sp.]
MHAAHTAMTPAAQALKTLQADDLFAGGEDVQQTDIAVTLADGELFEFTGTLTGPAELRNKPPRDGLHVVPVVCMHLKSTQPGGPSHCYVERAFTDATRGKAEAFIKDLKRGTPMTVRTRLAELRVSITHPTFIQPTEPTNAPAAQKA